MNWIKLQIEIIFLRVVREIRMNYMNSYQKLPLFCKKTTLLRILSRLLSAFVKTILLTQHNTSFVVPCCLFSFQTPSIFNAVWQFG